ncbi:hypothetical protein J4429_02850 [Candidatus Pacearchaeota archaeon]|nr:hypothetical protein [Candidatus Pacearchaeota archaeon]
MKSGKFSTNPLSKKIYAIILTTVILIAGSFFYFISLNNLDSSAQMEEKLSGGMNTDVSEKQMNAEDNYEKSIETQNINNANKKQASIPYIFKYELKGIQENNFYIKTSSDGAQKLFYYHPVDEDINVQLSEGDIEEYQIHSIGGQNYYPLILGYEEAEIMRKEGLFSNIGDSIKNFFGKNVVVIGIMQKTEGALDRAYFIPLNKEELN